MPYRIAHICKNGHCVSQSEGISIPETERFCKQCGAPIIAECENCHNPIQGRLWDPTFIGIPKYEIPSFCTKCGQPYPWTKAAIESASALIGEDEIMSDDEKNKLSESLPDIMSETPKTRLAAMRIKKALSVAGQFTAEGIRQFVIDFGCELALKSIGISK